MLDKKYQLNILFVLEFIVLTQISSYTAEFYFSKNPSPELNPSYLFKHFTNVSEEKFPSKLEISFAFSSFDGMLFTTLDQNTNFLVAEISNNIFYIHYNNESNEIYLPLLCNCRRKCLNERLNISVLNEINRMKFKCNDGGKYSLIKYSERPIKPNIRFIKTTITNQAKLWIMNHKKYPFLYRPYPKQMIGCIFEIKYKDKIMNMVHHGNHIANSCPKQINKTDVYNLCNGGKYVNFKCDCTSTLFNGPRCNEGVIGYKPVNIKMKLKYSLLKVSWWTNNDVIMNITTHLNDQIYGYLIIKKMNLTLIGDVYNSFGKKQSKEILANYDSNVMYSVILNFSDNKLVIQIPKVTTNGYWFEFLSIKTKNSNNMISVYGAISLGYKINSDIWKNVADLEIEQQSGVNCVQPIQPNIMDKCVSHTSKFIVMSILEFIIIIIIGPFCVYRLRYCIENMKQKRSQRKPYQKNIFINKSDQLLQYFLILDTIKRTTLYVRNILYLPSCPPFKLKYNNGQVTVDQLKQDIAEHINGNEQDILLWTNKQILTKNKRFHGNGELLEVDFVQAKEFEGLTTKEFHNIRKFGIVYKNILPDNTTIGTQVFKNVIKEKRHDDIQHILNEVKILQMVKGHENILQFHSFTRLGYHSLLISNYYVGWRLNNYIMEKIHLNDEEINFFLKQILNGLTFLHLKRIIHMDINCDNIFISKEDQVIKLAEFGASVILDEGCDYCTQKVNSTAKFMAPELLDEENRNYTTKADIWSLGCSIIQMATGQLPFSGFSENAARYQICQSHKVEYDRTHVSIYLQYLISRFIKLNPHDRPDALTSLEFIK